MVHPPHLSRRLATINTAMKIQTPSSLHLRPASLVACLLAFGFVAHSLSAAASASTTPAAPAPSAPVSTISTPATTHTASATSANYLLHTTDLLHLEVAGDPNSSHDVRLDSDGTASLPYLDDPVKLSGLTVNQAIKAIAKIYMDQHIFVKPQVSLVVVQYAEQHINVVGQVNSPGPVPIPPGQTMSLVDAVAAAKGHTRIAAHVVTINRKLPDGKVQTFTANLKQAMDDARYDVALQDGDSVMVDEALIGW